MAQVFPGRLAADNVGAADWFHGLVAYGCQSYVVVISPNSLELAQTLDEHHAPVTAVQWARVAHCASPSAAKLVLASGDANGNIIVWNVHEGKVATNIKESPGGVDRLEWQPESSEVLVSLHRAGSEKEKVPQGHVCAWSVASGTQLWALPVPEMLGGVSLAFSPFEPSVVGLGTTSGAIHFIYDFSTKGAPGRFERKCRLSSKPPTPASSGSTSGMLSKMPIPRVGGDKAAAAAAAAQPGEFRAFAFSPHAWNLVYFLLAREILVFDLPLQRAVASTLLDRGMEPFTQLALCPENPSLLYCMHEDGAVTAWHRKAGAYEYEMGGLADPMQQMRREKRRASAAGTLVTCPASPMRLASVALDGSFWVWEYQEIAHTDKPVQRVPKGRPSRRGRLVVTGYQESLAWPPRCMTVRGNLAAIGTDSGLVQVVDLARGATLRALSAIKYPVSGLSWAGDSRRLLVWGHEQADTPKGSSFSRYNTVLSLVDVVSGRVRDLRAPTKPEYFVIKDCKISPAGQYFTLIFRDGPVELWDLRLLQLVTTIRRDCPIIAVEWLASRDLLGKPSFLVAPEVLKEEGMLTYVPEQFVMTLANDGGNILSVATSQPTNPGNALVYTVVNGGTVSFTQVEVDLGMGLLNDVASKGAYVVSGDTTGTLFCFNAGTARTNAVPTHRGPVASLEFCSASSSGSAYTLLVLFQNGEVGIWDAGSGGRAAGNAFFAQRGINVLAASWSDDLPVVLCSDGCLRVLDRSLTTCNRAMRIASFESPSLTPIMLGAHALLVKSMLLNVRAPGISADHTAQLRKDAGPGVTGELFAAPDTLSVCLLVAKYMESLADVRLWSLLAHAIKKYSACSFSQEEEQHDSESRPETPLPAHQKEAAAPKVETTLAPFLNIFATPGELRDVETERVNVQAGLISRASGPEQQLELQKQIAGTNVLLGRKDEAVDLLVGTGSKLDYTSALKACIVAATISQTSFRNTTKLVATQLIAQGQLSEGVQLLVAIGKATDACKYLSSENKWADAAWLANLALGEPESFRILSGWASFLVATGRVGKALEVLVSIGDFHRALGLLATQRCFETAALFARCCEEANMFTRQRRSPALVEGLAPVQEIIAAVYNEYATYLSTYGGLDEVSKWYRDNSPAGVSVPNASPATSASPAATAPATTATSAVSVTDLLQ